MTPEEYRALADKHWLPILHEQEVAAALRTAADQLEAVQAFTNELRGAYGMEFAHGRLSAIFTADSSDASDE